MLIHGASKLGCSACRVTALLHALRVAHARVNDACALTRCRIPCSCRLAAVMEERATKLSEHFNDVVTRARLDLVSVSQRIVNERDAIVNTINELNRHLAYYMKDAYDNREVIRGLTTELAFARRCMRDWSGMAVFSLSSPPSHSSSSTYAWNRLSCDVMSYLLSFCDACSLTELAQCNRLLARACSLDMLWLDLILHDWRMDKQSTMQLANTGVSLKAKYMEWRTQTVRRVVQDKTRSRLPPSLPQCPCPKLSAEALFVPACTLALLAVSFFGIGCTSLSSSLRFLPFLLTCASFLVWATRTVYCELVTCTQNTFRLRDFIRYLDLPNRRFCASALFCALGLISLSLLLLSLHVWAVLELSKWVIAAPVFCVSLGTPVLACVVYSNTDCTRNALEFYACTSITSCMIGGCVALCVAWPHLLGVPLLFVFITLAVASGASWGHALEVAVPVSNRRVCVLFAAFYTVSLVFVVLFGMMVSFGGGEWWAGSCWALAGMLASAALLCGGSPNNPLRLDKHAAIWDEIGQVDRESRDRRAA